MKKLALLLLIFFWVGAACRPEPEPELTPEEIVQNTAQRMNQLSGFQFSITHSGPSAYLDPDNLVSLVRADGNYAAPDRAAATVLVKLTGFVTKVDVVSVAEVQWQTNPLTGQWEELPPNWGFNPAVLFDAEIGLPTILSADMSDLVLAGREKLEEGPDAELVVLTGKVAGDRLFSMSGGLIGPSVADAQLWVMPETFELVRVVLTEPAAGEEESASVWQVDFANYDQALEIEPPLS